MVHSLVHRKGAERLIFAGRGGMAGETVRGKSRKIFNLTLDEEARDPICFEDCHDCTINVRMCRAE